MALDDDAARVARMGRLSIRRALLTGWFTRAAGPTLGATAAALWAAVARE